MGSLRCPSVVFLAVSVALLLNADVALCSGCGFKRIFAFGDSVIDTGNFVYNMGSSPSALKEPPFGMTFFNHATGRVCDGRVLVDFYAEAFNLPLLPPRIPGEETGQFATGANFAVLASTALPPEYLRSQYNFTLYVPSDLRMQLDSFKKVLARRGDSISPPSNFVLESPLLARIAPGDGATRALLNESLIVLGEIGGNDYNFWFLGDPKNSRDTPDQYLPDVVTRIGAAAQEVIDLGARAVVVPGNFPLGCVPVYLNVHQSDNQSDYDEYGCLKWFNDFSQRHNGALKQEVARLRSQNPGVKVVYADYYGAALQLVVRPQQYGIADPLLACCGGDGKYHTGKPCDKAAKLWGSPDGFASWDGIHMTDKAYGIIANAVLDGSYADTPLSQLC